MSRKSLVVGVFIGLAIAVLVRQVPVMGQQRSVAPADLTVLCPAPCGANVFKQHAGEGFVVMDRSGNIWFYSLRASASSGGQRVTPIKLGTLESAGGSLDWAGIQ